MFNDFFLKDAQFNVFKEMSWRAVNKLNKESNDHFHWIPLRVLRVRMQLVAGMKYKLEILIGQSNCAKNVG